MKKFLTVLFIARHPNKKKIIRKQLFSPCVIVIYLFPCQLLLFRFLKNLQLNVTLDSRICAIQVCFVSLANNSTFRQTTIETMDISSGSDNSLVLKIIYC